MPRLAVLDHFDHVLTFLDNSLPEAMHYDEAVLHTYLQGSCYTFDLKASSQDEDSQYLIEGNKIAFVYKNRDYMCNIVNVSKDEKTVEVSCFGLVLELTNEVREPYKASKVMTFAEYLKTFDPEAVLTLGINEVSNKSMVLEWEGSSTVLARLYSIANSFNAELEFITVLNDNYSLNEITLNVYREHDDKYQGMGERKTGQILRWGKEIETIRKESDITDFYSAIRPRGRDGLDLTGYNRTEYDDNGDVLYYTSGNVIYAPQARDRFPSNLNNTWDRYASYDWEYDTDSQATLYGQALGQLKKYSVPQVTYEIKGYFDANIGDTFSIEDDGYTPMLILEARVTEQEEHFVDTTQNQTTFSNVIELKSEIDPSLLAAMRDMINRNKVFTCSISTDNGTQFKNLEGDTTLTAQVRDGKMDVTDRFRYQWFKNGAQVSTNRSIKVTAVDVIAKAVYRFVAYNGDGDSIGEAEVTLTNVNDGDDGPPGQDGGQGPAGVDGRDSHLHIAYADSADGKTRFSLTDASDRHYLGQYTDYNANASTDPAKYTWAMFRKDGRDGTPGDKGDSVVVGALSQSPIVVAADSSGNVSDYSSAKGTFEVHDGLTVVGSGVKYSVVSNSNIAVAINANTGAYSVTSMPTAADYGTSILQAVYNGITLQRTLAVIKSKQGASGKGVKSTQVRYQIGDSGTTAPTGTWLDNIPSVPATKYLWTRTVTTYTDDTGYTAYSVSKMGGDGKDGTNGADGVGVKSTQVRYQAGASGTDAPTGTWQDTIPTVSAGQYLWTRTVTNYTNNTSTTAYSVGKMGSNGANGDSGIIVSATAPKNPSTGQLWQDTSSGGQSIIKKWDGGSWQIWYLQAENLNVQRLDAISAEMGTIVNPYKVPAGSEWSEDEDITGKVSITGGGIKNEFDYDNSGWTGEWRLYPDRIFMQKKDESGKVKNTFEISPYGLLTYDLARGESVFVGYEELYRLKKLMPIWIDINMGYQKNQTITLIRNGDLVCLQGYWHFDLAAQLNNTNMNERIPAGFTPVKQTVFLRLVSKQHALVMNVKIRPSLNEEAGLVIVENAVNVPQGEDFWMNATWITADEYPS